MPHAAKSSASGKDCHSHISRSTLMRRNIIALTLLTCACALVFTQRASAATITMAPLTSFGGGDGWLSPGEGATAYLGTGNNERGLAYGNGHLYLVSHASVGGSTAHVRILDSATGADLGGLN